jgi:hypothetical protein
MLSGQLKDPAVESDGQSPASREAGLLATHSFGELCKLGLALTWPLVVVALGLLGVLLAVLLRR